METNWRKMCPVWWREISGFKEAEWERLLLLWFHRDVNQVGFLRLWKVPNLVRLRWHSTLQCSVSGSRPIKRPAHLGRKLLRPSSGSSRSCG